MMRRAYLYFVLTFLLGVIVGAGGAFIMGWYFGPAHHRFDQKRVVRFLNRELKLSDDQTRQVEEIMKDTDQKYRDLHHQVDPQFDAVREESRDRVRKILNPDQLAKFNELVRRFDERRKRQGPQ